MCSPMALQACSTTTSEISIKMARKRVAHAYLILRKSLSTVLTDGLAGLLHHNLVVAQGHEDELLDCTHFPNDDGAVSRVLRNFPCSHGVKMLTSLCSCCSRWVKITSSMSAVNVSVPRNRLQEVTMTAI